MKTIRIGPAQRGVAVAGAIGAAIACGFLGRTTAVVSPPEPTPTITVTATVTAGPRDGRVVMTPLRSDQ